MSTKKYFLIVIFVVLSLFATFYFGFLLKSLFTKEEKSNLKPYFSDEIILISKEKPHYTLIAYSSRKTKDNKNYAHRQRALFFNGDVWDGNMENTNSKTPDIAKTTLIPNWEIKTDPSLVLKQSVEGEVNINGQAVNFEVPVLENEIGVRSLENYTLFRSEADGKLVIDDKIYESYVLYTRIYSYATSIDQIEVSSPLGINTDWIAFWDNDGNFYNIDKTYTTSNYKGEIKNHAIAVLKDKEGRVQKSFDIDIQKKSKPGYEVNIFGRINKSFDVDIVNTVDKNISPSPYTWTTGQVKGPNGIGIFEQLYQ